MVDPGRGADRSPRDSPMSACRRRGALRRGRGVVTWKSGETVGTFLRRIGAGGALLELEARQVSRALRGELNRVLNAESANLQRAVGAAGRQLAAIDELEADGRLGRQPTVVGSSLRRAARRPRRRLPSWPSGWRSTGPPSSAPSSGSSGWPSTDEDGRAMVAGLDTGRPRGTRRTAAGGRRSGMIPAMRPVIIAANWKMHTTPADAGELARTIAGANAGARRGPGHLPALRLPGRGRGALAETDPDVAVGAQNVHHELAGAYTGEISRADAGRASRPG